MQVKMNIPHWFRSRFPARLELSNVKAIWILLIIYLVQTVPDLKCSLVSVVSLDIKMV